MRRMVNEIWNEISNTEYEIKYIECEIKGIV